MQSPQLAGRPLGSLVMVLQVLPHPLQLKVKFGVVVAPNNENDTELPEATLVKVLGTANPEEDVIVRLAGHPKLLVTLLVML
jgi:hypothetical protein